MDESSCSCKASMALACNLRSQSEVSDVTPAFAALLSVVVKKAVYPPEDTCSSELEPF